MDRNRGGREEWEEQGHILSCQYTPFSSKETQRKALILLGDKILLSTTVALKGSHEQQRFMWFVVH